MVLVAVDIGGTNVRVIIADEGEILIKVIQKTIHEGNRHTLPNQVISLIDAACNMIRIDQSEIIAVGVGSPGPFLRKNGLIYVVTPNLPWDEIPLEQDLRERCDVVEIGNGCVTAVKAESLFGAGQGFKNFVYITISTGIGGGIIQDERIMCGKNGNAAHIGHMYIADDGPRCGCGQFGDIESLCSGTALEKISQYGVEKMFKGYDPEKNGIIERTARNIGRWMASINAVLDTEKFAIGGSVFTNNQDILLPMIKEEFHQSFPALSQGVSIVPCELGVYVGDVGSLSLVMPPDWIESWQKTRPWENAPAPIEI